jgi:hypothetical protein
MFRDRFKAYSEGSESGAISLEKPETLKLLETVDTLLMYERGTRGPNADIVRYGSVKDITPLRNEITFRFVEKGRLTRNVVYEFDTRLDFEDWEQGHTHWAIKEGGIPQALLDRVQPRYDVVFSFAGEDRVYVEKVADYLASKGVHIFYDKFEEAALWGKDLAEHFDLIYRGGGQYCVIFISEAYAAKMWTRHERRAAIAHALTLSKEYILPARFDDTKIEGIRPTVGDISIRERSPREFAKLILEKLKKV